MEIVTMVKTRDGKLHQTEKDATKHCELKAADAFGKVIRRIKEENFTNSLTYLMEDKEARSLLSEAMSWLLDAEGVEGHVEA